MKNIKPLSNKVIGRMIDSYGEKTSPGGVIFMEKDGDADSIRPRWFEVTHIGPEQTDVQIGEYVLVSHGRWSRGFSLTGSTAEENQLYQLDTDEMIAVSAEEPNL